MPSYDIKTYVNYVNNDSEALGVSATVLILVDSKSNLVPAMTPVQIDNLTQFQYYFSDDISNYSFSLMTAYRLLSAGYTLLAINVRSCASQLAARITKDRKLTYFPVGDELAALPHETVDNEDLAIRIDITSITNNSYFLLQQTIKPVEGDAVVVPYICNTLIYTTAFPPIYGANYSRSIKLDLSELDNEKKICEYLKKMLMYNNSFFVSIAQDYSYIQIASRYKFDSIGVFRNMSVVYDPGFEQEFLSRILKKDRLLDLYSTYNSEIADLDVIISRDTSGYTLQVRKFAGDTVHTSESFTSATAAGIAALVNEKSLFLRMNLFGSYLPLGSFKLLRNEAENATVTDSDYEAAIDVIHSWKEDAANNFFTDLSVNIVYEPDVYSIRSQALLNNIFDSANSPIIKVMNYLGLGDEEKNPMSCYFDCAVYTLSDNTVRTSKEIYLEGLMDFSLGEIRSDILSRIELRKQQYPTFVNQIKLTPTGYSVDRITCFYNSKRFDLIELLPISLINKVIRGNGYSTELDMISAKNQVNDYMTQRLGYPYELDLMYYLNYEGIIAVGFSYEAAGREDIDTIELMLNARRE